MTSSGRHFIDRVPRVNKLVHTNTQVCATDRPVSAIAVIAQAAHSESEDYITLDPA